VKAGATTTWERWDALRPDGSVNETKMSNDNMVSFNHYSFGSVGKFFYEYVLGITPAEPGFKKVRIAPKIDERIGDFCGHYRGIYVKYNNSCLHICTNTNSTIILPDGRELEKRVLRWFVSLEKVADAKIPEMSETQAYKNHIQGYAQGSTPAGDGFMNIPDGIDEELPFN
jgi:hypothetical protein